MSNKNPFEIRTEMLSLAKDYMDQQYQMNVSFAEKMLEQGKSSMEEFQSHCKMSVSYTHLTLPTKRIV